jgi:nucleoside-diphosphate-sugar epimerase
MDRMAAAERGVRAGQTMATVAVTGAGTDLGTLVVRRLTDAADVASVVPVETVERLPRRRLDGIDAVVHLDVSRDPDAPDRRAVNVTRTGRLLDAAAAAGVARVVLVTSAMVFGARPDNPVPLAEYSPVLADADDTILGDWVEIERLAVEATRAHPATAVTVLRPAPLVGSDLVDPMLRMFEAPRLLAIRGGAAHWQFCHVDDLVSAVEWAVLGRVDGPVTVGCEGWLDQADIERISGLRSIVVPAAAAFATADRLHRAGLLPAPASELDYLTHPWVVGAQRLRAAGWAPAWGNEALLRDHIDRLGDRRAKGARLQRRAAAGAGAAVAVVGAVALARTRAARRRRRG